MTPTLHITTPVLLYSLQNYSVAGLFEEAVKYFSIRSTFQSPMVVGPRSLVVYSACAGKQERVLVE